MGKNMVVRKAGMLLIAVAALIWGATGCVTGGVDVDQDGYGGGVRVSQSVGESDG